MTDHIDDTAPPRKGALLLEDEDLVLLAAFARGLNKEQVISELHLSRRTLTRRMADVRSVLGVQTNIEAIVIAVRSKRI